MENNPREDDEEEEEALRAHNLNSSCKSLFSGINRLSARHELEIAEIIIFFSQKVQPPLPVSLVVHGNYIHGDVILLMGVQTRDLDAHGREHPPGRKSK